MYTQGCIIAGFSLYQEWRCKYLFLLNILLGNPARAAASLMDMKSSGWYIKLKNHSRRLTQLNAN
jgi:hypothetical protein